MMLGLNDLKIAQIPRGNEDSVEPVGCSFIYTISSRRRVFYQPDGLIDLSALDAVVFFEPGIVFVIQFAL